MTSSPAGKPMAAIVTAPLRRSATSLVVAGITSCGLVVIVAALLVLTPPGHHMADAPNDRIVLEWLLIVSIATAFGFALLAYDRHRAFAAARRAEHSFRDLYNSINEGVFRSTLDGKMISANPALVRLNGYDTEDELIRACNDIAAEWYVEPNRRAEIHQMLVERGQVTNVVSEVYRHKTRERIWIEECTRLVRDTKTGEPLYYEGNVSEVTETMRRLELQGYYDKIASIMSGCLYQYRVRADGSRCLPYASVGLHHIFGVHPEDVAENVDAIRALIHPDDLHRMLAAIEHSRATLTPYQCEQRIRLPDGTEKWVLAHSVPEREADGSTLWHGYMVDVSDRKRSEARIYELAYLDPLTHLPNRTSLHERLNQELTRKDTAGACGALLYIDLDHFKVLNDTKGHHVGDLLLCEIAARLRRCIGPDDMVARIGGDEFVVLMGARGDDASAVQAETRRLGMHILSTIDQPFGHEDDTFQTTASLGAVLFYGGVHNVDEVLKQADLAMYAAKAAGRGTMRFFEAGMQVAAADRLTLTTDLRQAQRLDRLALHYQPIVDRTGRCVGAEALLRWNHPTRGLISAGDFIALAEHSGLMGSIDRWVLEVACLTLKNWERDPRTRDLQLSVNVGAREMSRTDFVDTVKNALAASGARADRLTLELTEHVMLDDIDVVTAVMSSLQELGLHFALDDFGTGYSSLSYLKRLPINTLKIDRSFVRDIETDKSDREIVHTILNVARSLRLPVIAEGVETELQAVLLRQLGCHGFQGYLFGRPMPIEAFTAYLDGQAVAPGSTHVPEEDPAARSIRATA